MDTLYYSTAIAAILIIFIANGNERLINKTSLEMEEKEELLSQDRNLLSQMEDAQAHREVQLTILRADVDNAKAVLDAPWAKCAFLMIVTTVSYPL